MLMQPAKYVSLVTPSNNNVKSGGFNVLVNFLVP